MIKTPEELATAKEMVKAIVADIKDNFPEEAAKLKEELTSEITV